MATLPPTLLSDVNSEVVARLIDPDVRADLLANWFPLLTADRDMGPEWPDDMTLAHIAAKEVPMGPRPYRARGGRSAWEPTPRPSRSMFSRRPTSK